MTLHSRLRHPVAVLLSAALGLSACGKDETAAAPAPAPASPPAAAAAPTSVAAALDQAAQVDQHVKAQPTGVAAGQAVRGSITTTFDGQPQQWHITTLADTSRTSAGMVTDIGGPKEVTLWGQAASETPAATGSFKLDFSYSGELSATTPLQLQDAQATWIIGKGFMPPHWTSLDDLQITLTQAQFDGQQGRIEGEFSGQLCLREKTTQPVDETNCKPVQGRFASDLAPEVL